MYSKWFLYNNAVFRKIDFYFYFYFVYPCHVFRKCIVPQPTVGDNMLYKCSLLLLVAIMYFCVNLIHCPCLFMFKNEIRVGAEVGGLACDILSELNM